MKEKFNTTIKTKEDMERYLDRTCKDVNVVHRVIYDSEGNKKYWKHFSESMKRYEREFDEYEELDEE